LVEQAKTIQRGFSGNIEKGLEMVNKISAPSPVCFGTGFDAFFGT